jgi:hypothetical protein
MTITAPVNSLEASLIFVTLQDGRESTGGSDLTLHLTIQGVEGQTHAS